jgi:hypothetical protein
MSKRCAIYAYAFMPTLESADKVCAPVGLSLIGVHTDARSLLYVQLDNEVCKISKSQSEEFMLFCIAFEA